MTEPRPAAEGAVANIYLALHRVINAPVEAVYAAWTEPEMLRRWMAPGNAAVVHAVAEAAVGGTFLVEMRGADGKRWLVRGRYREVAPLRRLVKTWHWEGSGIETLVTVEFEPLAPGRTRLTLTHSRFAEDEARDEHVHGWNACLSKLKALWGG